MGKSARRVRAGPAKPGYGPPSAARRRGKIGLYSALFVKKGQILRRVRCYIRVNSNIFMNPIDQTRGGGEDIAIPTIALIM